MNPNNFKNMFRSFDPSLFLPGFGSGTFKQFISDFDLAAPEVVLLMLDKLGFRIV